MTLRILVPILLAFLLGSEPRSGYAQSGAVLIEDFESYEEGSVPARWKFFTRRDQDFISLKGMMSENERFYVVREGGRKFLRAYTKAEAQRISLGNGVHGLDWNLNRHSRLAWEWRALKLPEGAREDRTNDTGGAVYVTFDKRDWLGRPHSIKYTYSSTLPVGSTVRSGNVRVIVVSSGRDRIGDWHRVERNVVEDYRSLFGSSAPEKPFSITLWSDSDDTRSEAEVDFDNIRLLP